MPSSPRTNAMWESGPHKIKVLYAFARILERELNNVRDNNTVMRNYLKKRSDEGDMHAAAILDSLEDDTTDHPEKAMILPLADLQEPKPLTIRRGRK